MGIFSFKKNRLKFIEKSIDEIRQVYFRTVEEYKEYSREHLRMDFIQE